MGFVVNKATLGHDSPRIAQFSLANCHSADSTGRTKAWVCGRSLAGIVGSNPAGGMDVCYECCVLSGRGLCGEPITRPEESYRVWCV